MTDDLARRIADALGWPPQDVSSMSCQSLREIVRPVSPELAHELTFLIRSHAIVTRVRS